MQNPDVIETLLICLHTMPTSDQFSRLEAIPDETWELVVRLALKQQVGPVLLGYLEKRHMVHLLPMSVVRQLRELYNLIALKNLKINLELSTVLDEFARHDISVIVLKGAYLAPKVYPASAPRMFGDIDLLVQQGQVSRAAQVLNTLGYRSKQLHVTPWNEQHHKHLPRFFKENSVAGIELHWRILSPKTTSTLDPASLWSRASPVAFDAYQALVLSPEDMLLHICCHAVYEHHLGLDIRFLTDIAFLVDHFGQTLDWDAAVQRADQWHCARGVYIGLFLAHQLLGVPIPEGCLRRLSEHVSEDFHLDSLKSLMFAQSQWKGMSNDFVHAQVEQDWFAKIYSATRRVLIPREQLAALYFTNPDSPQIYFYYLMRIKDLLQRYLTYATTRSSEFDTYVDLRVEFMKWLREV